MGWNRFCNRVCTESWPWRRKFSHCCCRELYPSRFRHESSALPLIYPCPLVLCFVSWLVFYPWYEAKQIKMVSVWHPWREAGDVWWPPLSGISGLSFDSPFLSPLLFFCLVLLLFLSCHFSANGPFSLLFFHVVLVFAIMHWYKKRSFFNCFCPFLFYIFL